MSSDESKLEEDGTDCMLSDVVEHFKKWKHKDKKLTGLKANKSKDVKWFNVTTASWQWAASCSWKKEILKELKYQIKH